MACYHLSVKFISRGQGRSSIGAAAYRSGEKLYNDHDGLTHDYTRKSGITHTEILLPENAPQEYFDRQTLWNAVEKAEKRNDSRTAREIEIALPLEFTKEQNIELVQEFVKSTLLPQGMCVDVAFHSGRHSHRKDMHHIEAESDAMITPDNPHAHILLTTRPVDTDGFLPKKNRAWENKKNVVVWREQWANAQNKAFERMGLDVRVDHRSHKDRGLEDKPTIHEGVVVRQMERRGIRTEIGDTNRQIRQENKNRAILIQELQKEQARSRELATTEKRFNELKKEIQESKKSVMLQLEALEALGKQKREPVQRQEPKLKPEQETMRGNLNKFESPTSLRPAQKAQSKAEKPKLTERATPVVEKQSPIPSPIPSATLNRAIKAVMDKDRQKHEPVQRQEPISRQKPRQAVKLNNIKIPESTTILKPQQETQPRAEQSKLITAEKQPPTPSPVSSVTLNEAIKAVMDKTEQRRVDTMQTQITDKELDYITLKYKDLEAARHDLATYDVRIEFLKNQDRQLPITRLVEKVDIRGQIKEAERAKSQLERTLYKNYKIAPSELSQEIKKSQETLKAVHGKDSSQRFDLEKLQNQRAPQPLRQESTSPHRQEREVQRHEPKPAQEVKKEPVHDAPARTERPTVLRPEREIQLRPENEKPDSEPLLRPEKPIELRSERKTLYRSEPEQGRSRSNKK